MRSRPTSPLRPRATTATSTPTARSTTTGSGQAVINFDEGVWYCNTEGIGGSIKDLMERSDDWVDPPEGQASNSGGRTRRATKQRSFRQTSDVERWKVILQHDDIALED
jgi:hypothetical protein